MIINFAAPEHARELAQREDDYTRALTRFDLQAKVQSLEELDSRRYLQNATRYIYAWTSHERKYLEKIISETERKIRELGLKFRLPPVIELVKSAMHEEGNANGYTRSNVIFLNFNSLSGHLFEHELFHIISRFNEDKQELAYKILGFTKCNEVQLPEPFIHRKISNPDAPHNNFYIRLKYKGREIEAILIIYSNKDYAGGNFFRYVQKGLLLVEGTEGSKTPVLKNGRPVVLGFDEVEGLYEQIGRNTGYNIHQEEVTADHFIMLLDGKQGLPDPSKIEDLRKILTA